MSYKIHKNQTGLAEKKVRYEFYVFIKKRFRETVVSTKSRVEHDYSLWLAEKQKEADNLLLNEDEKKEAELKAKLREEIITELEMQKKTSKEKKFFETLDEYLSFVKVNKSPKEYLFENTVINKMVKVFFKSELLLSEVTRIDADDFIEWRKNFSLPANRKTVKAKVSNSTLNHTVGVLSCFFNWCIKKNYYNQMNPFLMQRRRENNYREIMLTMDEINSLLAEAKVIGETFYQTVLILMITGMRRGELFSLTWTEVNFEDHFIMLSKDKTKTKKRRHIPMSSTLEAVLESLPKDGERVMGGYTTHILEKQWKKLILRISSTVLKGKISLHVHDLRHIFAQTMLNQNVSLEDVQSLLGHQSFQTTERRYVHYARPDLLEKVQKLDEVFCMT